MILPIITHPNEILRTKAKEVANIKSDEIQQLILDMIETMLKKDGIGLAASQINKSLRIIIVNTEKGAIALINPKITKKSWKREDGEEGCLSIPGIFGIVKRYKSITVNFIDQNGDSRELKASDLLARIIQHEIDHLDGILFIDKAKKITHGKI